MDREIGMADYFSFFQSFLLKASIFLPKFWKNISPSSILTPAVARAMAIPTFFWKYLFSMMMLFVALKAIPFPHKTPTPRMR